MGIRLFDVRKGEGRTALLRFAALLLVVITGHTILEAARDALLLAGPGPRALGVVYMTIAVIAWPAAALASRANERLGARGALAGSLVLAAVLPVGLLLARPGPLVSIALYVVSGLIGSIVVPQFWTFVGQALTLAQGRRLFGVIAAAGVLGGVTGSGLAAAALLVLPVRSLLLLAAGMFVVAFAAVLRMQDVGRSPRSARLAPPAARESWSTLRREPLVTRIALSVVVSTATLLALDYCFKSAVARTLPSASIGPFVARYYLALNGLSLAVQVLLGSAIVQRMGVTKAMVLTPLLIVVGAVGVVLGGGALVPVLLLKGVDGALRFSVHRITGELVYLPVPVPVRRRLKPFIDGALARASQTVTGVALLAFGGSWYLSPRPLAVIVGILAASWLAIALRMRRPYLSMLRSAISLRKLDEQENPEPLDLESAQLLVQHLASEDPREVVAVMNALCRRGQVGFVPALVLLHPDETVLAQALEHFGACSRVDWVPMAHRLLADAREGVRLAAARALSMHGALDPERLAGDRSPRVAGYAAVELAMRDRASDALEYPPIASRLGSHEADVATPARLGMLAAIADAPPTRSLSRLLLALGEASSDGAEYGELFARAAGQQKDTRLIARLVDRLGSREGREAIRGALVAFGDEAFESVRWALRDTSRPRRFRIHLPKTLARFGTKRAVEDLLENIETEEDGLVRYKSIRALQRLVVSGPLRIDRPRVEHIAYADLLRHFGLMASLVALDPSPAGAGAGRAAERLLAGLLEDKLRQSLERVFRLLAIAHPRYDFDRLRIATLSGDAFARASAGEFLDTLLRRRDQQGLRSLLHIVADDLPRSERLARAVPLVHGMWPATRDDALAQLEHDRDPIVGALAAACSKPVASGRRRAAGATRGGQFRA
jgi:hypothetical protein